MPAAAAAAAAVVDDDVGFVDDRVDDRVNNRVNDRVNNRVNDRVNDRVGRVGVVASDERHVRVLEEAGVRRHRLEKVWGVGLRR